MKRETAATMSEPDDHPYYCWECDKTFLAPKMAFEIKPPCPHCKRRLKVVDAEIKPDRLRAP